MSGLRWVAVVAGAGALVMAATVAVLEVSRQDLAGALRTSSVFWLLGGALLACGLVKSRP